MVGESSSPLSCTDYAKLSRAIFSLKWSWNFRAFSYSVCFAPIKNVCTGWTTADWHCRTHFLGGLSRLSSAHRVRDDVMPCEHLFSDNDSVEYSTSSHMCSFFFITRQSPSWHSVVCGFSVMFLSMVRFRHVIRFWSGYYNHLIFSEIPGLWFLGVSVF
jgi:hypothetical protein